MTAIYIIIGVLVLFNVWIIRIYLRIGKHLPPMPKEDAEYYDENGNHIYYDRKQIARLEAERQQATEK